MKMRAAKLPAIVVLAVGTAGAFALAPTEYSLDWFTVDGGGRTDMVGGHFELSGTIGQWDAGTPMTGRGFTLTGGFWFGITQDDCNSDGGVNLYDYEDLRTCLQGPSADPGHDYCGCFDSDRDKDIDLLDFAEFQGLFQNP